MNFPRLRRPGEHCLEPQAPIESIRAPGIASSESEASAPASILPAPVCPCCSKVTGRNVDLLAEWGMTACFCQQCTMGCVEGDVIDGHLQWWSILNSPRNDVLQAIRKRAMILQDVMAMDGRCREMITSGIADGRWLILQKMG